jgi:hypothetical protein
MEETRQAIKSIDLLSQMDPPLIELIPVSVSYKSLIDRYLSLFPFLIFLSRFHYLRDI